MHLNEMFFGYMVGGVRQPSLLFTRTSKQQYLKTGFCLTPTSVGQRLGSLSFIFEYPVTAFEYLILGNDLRDA